MVSAFARFPASQVAALVLPVLAAGFIAWKTLAPSGQSLSGGAAGFNAAAVDQMKESVERDRKLLAAYEREQSRLRVEVINRRKLFADGQIGKEQVHEAEQSFVAALRRLHEMRHAVVEADIAITEALLGAKVERLPLNAYSENGDLAHFNGPVKWSLKEAPRIERYFSQTFGRRLPVTARGQSRTHDRLRFDHREAMDVAVHPDSAEGKALIAHLRGAGIPFTAFRTAIAGTSTGAHIHIGKPSRRWTH
jgi:hypothetical protein